MIEATVAVREQTYVLGPDDRFTFGRARDCTACLDPDDTAISRRAGAIEHERGTWWLTNRSSARPLSVIDDVGFRSVLAPGRRTALEVPTRVIVDGMRASHTIRIEVAVARVPPEESATPAGASTAIGETVLVSPADRMAMLALFMGYLQDPPRYDPHPKSYAAAAARLGWPRTTLVKRIEYLRTRLTDAGVPNLMGWNALANLAEYALARRLITKDDLRKLQR
jgi:hypothetical protein